MLIKNKNKTRLVGKVAGYYVDLEKHTENKSRNEIVKDILALSAIIFGFGLFYFLFP